MLSFRGGFNLKIHILSLLHCIEIDNMNSVPSAVTVTSISRNSFFLLLFVL